MRRLVIILSLCLISESAFAQDHYTLKVIRPMPVGAAGSGLDAENRVYRAYTGIPYNIKADAIGGDWPYTYSLSGNPAAMTIVAGPCTVIGPTCDAGTINWPSPDATDSSITVTICDVDNDCAQAVWGVTVSAPGPGADGVCFLDADDGDDGGAGTLVDPWQTIDKAYDSCGARSMMYLRGATATYNFTGVPTAGSNCGGVGGDPATSGTRVQFNESSRPVIWLGYPAESPVIDFGYVEGVNNNPCVEPIGQNIWFDNITFNNCPWTCVNSSRSSRFGITVRRITIDGVGPGAASQNPAGFMWASTYSGSDPDTQNFHDVFVNNIIRNVTGASGYTSCVKLYSMLEALIAYNSFTTVSSTECVAIKSDNSQFTVRANVFEGITGLAIAGNNHQVADQTYGEILFNNCKDSTDYCLDVNQDGQAGVFYIYRNTFQGEVLVRNTDTGDGPFTFVRNVIVNDGGSGGSCPERLTCSAVTDYTVIVVNANNLQGVDDGAIVNAAGELQGTNLTDHGPSSGTPKGHMLGPAGGAPHRIRRVSLDLFDRFYFHEVHQ